MALDAQIKLMRLGIPAVWHPDAHAQAMAAAGLARGDVVIALGVHGAAPELVRAARIARRAGAAVIGLARRDAPLAAVSDVFLAVDTAEDTEIFTPSVSRLAVLLVVDILTTAVMAARGPAVVEQLRRVKRAVQPPVTARPPRTSLGGSP
jgi:RpiR family carbohydrate utilization transcriptional regulator